LRSRGVHDLDVLILSHAHADHIGDAIELMQNMAIGQIYMNQATYDKLIEHEEESISTIEDTYASKDNADASKGDANASNDDTYESVQNFLNRQSITILEKPIEQIYETHSGQTMTLSILPIKSKSGEEDPNDDALAVALEYDGSLGYFLGDISTPLIDVLLETQSEQIAEYGAIDFIKSAHHGSKTAINLNLYTNYGIDYVITSCGTKYKMPTVKLEGVLEEQGIDHYTTYESGEIDMILSRETIKIKRFLW
jgi:competence protein ComEC